jgi:hypothetical protein
VILAEKATLEEIDRYWTITDIRDANEAIDVDDDVVEAYRQAKLALRETTALEPPQRARPLRQARRRPSR